MPTRLFSLTIFQFAILSISFAQADPGSDPFGACDHLLLNISPPGAAKGAVVASPSKSNPNYFYHWVRDAGLVMDTVVTLYQKATNPESRSYFAKILFDYIDFSRSNQLTNNLSGTVGDTGLGEPKFEADGRAFDAPWGRPQNDGPAIRASALIRYAKILLAEGKSEFVRSRLYDGKIPAHSVIKSDLEFVAHHWRDLSFDLWEEVKGSHFYTRMVQRKALIDGAELAELLGDPGAAGFYRQQAKKLEVEIDKHWDGHGQQLITSFDFQFGDRAKASRLDIASVLGALHGDTRDGFYSPTSDRVLATAAKLKQVFQGKYPINARTTDFDGKRVEVAIGRYPEDTYDGYKVGSVGNPWVLATNAFAELCYKVAGKMIEDGQFVISELNLSFFKLMTPDVELHAGEILRREDARFTALVNSLREEGDAFMRRSKLHGFPGGALSEQMHRSTGFMQGANDLTWNYASVITATLARP
jgi:glucoamylase